MHYCLPGYLSAVYADVETLNRFILAFDTALQPPEQFKAFIYFRLRHGEKIWTMSFRYD